MSQSGYIVYELVDPRVGRPFYVGKGRPSRPHVHTTEARRWHEAGRPTDVAWQRRNRKKLAFIADLLTEGLAPHVNIVATCATSAEAEELERAHIALLGLKNLTNVLPGGQPGLHWSAALAQRLSDSLRGRVFSPEHRARIGDARRGKNHTPETKKKMRAAAQGRRPSIGCLLAAAEAVRGKPRPMAVKSVISAANKQRVWTEESRNKISCANRRRTKHPTVYAICRGCKQHAEHRQTVLKGVLTIQRLCKECLRLANRRYAARRKVRTHP